MKKRPFREQARVLLHLDNGYTKISIESTEGLGLANGGAEWDIPTASIPPHLRKIGSRFFVTGNFITPEEQDTAADMREEWQIKVDEN